MDYFLLFLAVLCIAVQFNVNKAYQKNFVRGMKDMFFFPFAGACVNLIFFTFLSVVMHGGMPGFTGFSFVVSIVFALIGALSSLVGILIMKYGKMSVYSVFMMLGGMILPYFYGLFFLSETISAARVIGLLILVCALPCSVISHDGKEKPAGATSKFFFMLCIFIFVLNGLTSITAKTHAISDYALPAANFIVYVNIWSICINGTAFFVFKHHQQKAGSAETAEAKPNINRAFITAAVFAIIGGTGFLLQLIAAETVPAVAMFPFVTGGAIVLSTICAWIFFKEKIGKPALAGIIMAICGTLLFLIQ